jgi:hypothetical protein
VRKKRSRRVVGDVVDLPRVRRALAELDRLAQEQPEAFRLTVEEWRAVLAEDERMAVTKVVALRLPDDVLERVDAHARRLRELTGLEPSRAEVLKLLIERGLHSVEAAATELDKHKPRKR